MKKSILLIAAFFCFQVFYSQEVSKEKKEELSKQDTIVNENSKPLTANEKYAVKMLKSGYKIKSIVLQTNLTKQRVRELKKEHL